MCAGSGLTWTCTHTGTYPHRPSQSSPMCAPAHPSASVSRRCRHIGHTCVTHGHTTPLPVHTLCTRAWRRVRRAHTGLNAQFKGAPGHSTMKIHYILFYFILFYFKIFYLFMIERSRDTGRERSRLHALGARRGTRSRVSRIAPWAKGRRQTAAPPRDPRSITF